MTTSDLIEYIKLQISKNVSRDLIVSRLSQTGWHIEDIEEGFTTVQSIMVESKSFVLEVPQVPQVPQVAQVAKEEPIVNSSFSKETEDKTKIDPYREIPEGIEIPVVQKIENTHLEDETKKQEPVKLWIPTSVLPKIKGPEISSTTETETINLEPKKEETPVVVEIPKVEELTSTSLRVEDLVKKEETPVILEIPKAEELTSLSSLAEELPTKKPEPISEIDKPQDIISEMKELKKEEYITSLYSQDVPVSNIEPAKLEIKEGEISVSNILNKEAVRIEDFVVPVHTEIETYNLEVGSGKEIPVVTHVDVVIPEVKQETESLLPKTEEVNLYPYAETEPSELAKKEEVKFPPIIPRVESIKTEEIKIELPKLEIKKEETFQVEKPAEFPFIPVINKIISQELPANIVTISTPTLKLTNNNSPLHNVMSDVVPKSAMIASYSQDLLSADKKEEEVVTKKIHPLKKWGIIISIICLLGLLIFTFVEGYLKIPGSNFSFSFVKKDPKTIILNAPNAISKLKSYKVETNINISSPSMANITSGLSSGRVSTSKETDSISINAKGSTSHGSDNLNFDYLLNLKSSILKNDITSELKYDGSSLSFFVPNLSEILNKDAPRPTTVSFTPEQIGLIVPEFSPSVQDFIKKIDAYDMVSKGVSFYVKNEAAAIFKEFITGLQYTDQGEESIHGVDTYHYEMIADRAQTKKFLTSLSDLFVVNIPSDQKNDLNEILGSSVISSFDVWVGKNDNNIYQIKFVIDAPLSRVLSLNDSGIAGGEVKLEWQTTYYDLDVPNNIDKISAQTNIEGFIKSIQDSKIKNIISVFKPQATSLRNVIGVFGLRSNPAGSCTNPNPGSLFSPLGHTKNADNAVSSISSTMKSLLLASNGTGSCYSTSGAWALSAPLSTNINSSLPALNSNSFYCADSVGNITTLQNPISGTICK